MTGRTAILAALLVGVASAEPPRAVRNPFWPIGHEGVSTPISAEVRKKPEPPPEPPKPSPEEVKQKEMTAAKAAAEAAAAKAKAEAEAKERAAKAAAAAKAAKEKAEREAALRAVITDADWAKAGRALKISMPAVFTDPDGAKHYSVKINENIYSDGDLMSTTHDGIRFTWRVQSLEKGRESLKLARVRAYRIPDVKNGESK
jgi:hypothetical protein